MKKIFLAILLVAASTIFFSSCPDTTPIPPPKPCTIIVQNYGSCDAKIYLDGKYLSIVYEKEIETFKISVGSHNLKAVMVCTGQELHHSFSVSWGGTYIYTIYKE